TSYLVIISDSEGNFNNITPLGDFSTDKSGTFSVQIPNNLPPGDKYLVKLFTDSDSFPIEIIEKINTNFVGPSVVCIGLEQTYRSENNDGRYYNWEVVNGTIIGPDDQQDITVLWDNKGTGTVSLTEAKDNISCVGFSSKNVLIDFDDYQIDGKDLICFGEYEQEYSNSDLGVQKKWTVNGGSIIGNDNEDLLKVLWDGPGNKSINLDLTVIAGSCKKEANLDVFVSDEPIISSEINGNFSVCNNSEEIYSILNNPNNTYQWIVNGGTIIGDNDKSEVLVDWGAASAASIRSIETTPFGCSVELYESVSINAFGREIKGDLTVCLRGTYFVDPIEGVENIWSVIGGNIIGDPSSNEIQVDWNDNGPYIIKLESISSSGDCSKNITKLISKTEPKDISIKVDDYNFNPKVDTYEVSIPLELVNGDCLAENEGLDSITSYVRLNKSSFLPSINNIQSYFDTGKWRTIVIKDSVPKFSEGELIYNISGFVLLGNEVESTIHIDSMFIGSKKIDLQPINGKIILVGVEDQSGYRLINNNNVEIVTVYPTPISNNQLNIVTNHDSNIEVQLEIYSILGEVVYSENILLEKDETESIIAIPTNIAKGIYRVVLLDKNSTSSVNVIIE
ncbi:T9SS type A sorting domain-containing protein, partial [Candidatus Kapabacteria bacterium]|nr:T9SS type A sorting domain-containing protein [Candidatus Kapabacteria bacterium]